MVEREPVALEADESRETEDDMDMIVLMDPVGERDLDAVASC